MTHISPSTGLAASKISKRIKNSGRKRKYMTSKHNLMKSSENRSTSISNNANKIDRFEKILTNGKSDQKKVVTSEVVLIILLDKVQNRLRNFTSVDNLFNHKKLKTTKNQMSKREYPFSLKDTKKRLGIVFIEDF